MVTLDLFPQLTEGEILKLADAFAGDFKFLTDFFERVLAASVEAEAHFDNAGLTGVQRIDHLAQVLFEVFIA